MKSKLKNNENDMPASDTSSDSNMESSREKTECPRKKLDKCLAKAFSNINMNAEEYAAVRIINWVNNTMNRVDKDLRR